MPRRPNHQNKSLPKFLQDGREKFEHWGRRLNEIFPDEQTSSPAHLIAGSSSQSEADSLQFIEYQLPDETSRDSLDEMPPTESCTDTTQPSSSRQRSKRSTQNTPRSMTNDPASRPACQSRRRKSRRLRHETGYPADDTEASQISPSNDPNSSLAISSHRALINESTDHDRCTSRVFVQESLDPFTREARLSIQDKMPASFPRSPQRSVFFEPFPISPPAGANGSSQTINPFPIPPSNQGTQPGSFPPVMGAFSSEDAARANPAVGQYPSFPIFEPPISSPRDFIPLTYSLTCMDSVHGSSSSLSPMAQSGYYYENYGPTDDGTLPSNRFVPPQPIFSVNPQNYSGPSINNPVGTHSTYAASNQRPSHVRSPSFHTASSSSQLTQTTQAYVPTFGVNADVQDTFFLPEMDYRTLPRSYYFQEQQYGLSQGEVYSRSQRSRHTSPGLSQTYDSTEYNQPPNAVATSSASRLGQKSSSSVPFKDPRW